MTHYDQSLRLSLHAELHYHVLSHLDLGRDAANLYRDDREDRPWVDGLLEAYRAAPGRLMLHVLGLLGEEVMKTSWRLRGGMRGLDDPNGRLLAERFADALETENPIVRTRWESERDAMRERVSTVWREWGPVIGRVRETMTDEAPTPLRVYHSPSLRAGSESVWTHGRATTWRGERLVAVSFDAAPEHVAVQVIHEETHTVTDPPIREQFSRVAQDTSEGSDGFELHRRLEEAAVARGQDVLEDVAPELLDAYERWRVRYDM